MHRGYHHRRPVVEKEYFTVRRARATMLPSKMFIERPENEDPEPWPYRKRKFSGRWYFVQLKFVCDGQTLTMSRIPVGLGTAWRLLRESSDRSLPHVSLEEDQGVPVPEDNIFVIVNISRWHQPRVYSVHLYDHIGAPDSCAELDDVEQGEVAVFQVVRPDDKMARMDTASRPLELTVDAQSQSPDEIQQAPTIKTECHSACCEEQKGEVEGHKMTSCVSSREGSSNNHSLKKEEVKGEEEKEEEVAREEDSSDSDSIYDAALEYQFGEEPEVGDNGAYQGTVTETGGNDGARSWFNYWTRRYEMASCPPKDEATGQCSTDACTSNSEHSNELLRELAHLRELRASGILVNDRDGGEMKEQPVAARPEIEDAGVEIDSDDEYEEAGDYRTDEERDCVEKVNRNEVGEVIDGKSESESEWESECVDDWGSDEEETGLLQKTNFEAPEADHKKEESKGESKGEIAIENDEEQTIDDDPNLDFEDASDSF